MPFIAIALVIAAALGGGTAALAQSSLPGNPLWGFKVNVNESVAGALSANDTAKADWDLNAIQTRLDEAQALSAKGQLNTTAQADISANLKAHAEGVTNAIAKLQASGDSQDAADIAARYQAALSGAPVLSVDASGSASNSTGALTTTVRDTLEQASNLSASVAASIH